MKVKNDIHIWLTNTDIILSAYRGLYLPLQDILVVSDLHLGKASHFQKHGLAIPGEVAKDDLVRLETLIRHYNPSRVVIAGDLFHAAHNSEWDLFLQWLGMWPNISFHLVKGNHDRLNESFYTKAGLIIHPNQYDLVDGQIVHIPSPDPGNKLEISGHIHPGIRLMGKGRQRMRVPCFIIRGNHIILPAFSLFTGLDTRFAQEEDEIYAIVEDEIVHMS